MTLTERTLNRTTLHRQMLLQREQRPVPDAIRRVVALQAQHAASPYVALWNRLVDFDPVELDAAFAAHDVVKATMMRITLHAVHGDDYRLFREAMETTLKGSRLGEHLKDTMLQDDAARGALVADLQTFAAERRTSAAVEAWLLERLGLEPRARTWQLLRGYIPLLHAPGGPPWTFGPRATWLAPRDIPMLADPAVAPRALAQLIRRYLAGFGPATVPDMATFLLVQRWRIKEALATMDDLVQLTGPGKIPYFDLPGLMLTDAETPAPPRLMAMWDSVLLANYDRRRVVPADYRKTVIRTNGDVLPTILVDGYVAGLWRTVDRRVEVMAFHELSQDVWEGLEQEAHSLVGMLADRDPGVYRRYDHWWTHLPERETRLLAQS